MLGAKEQVGGLSQRRGIGPRAPARVGGRLDIYIRFLVEHVHGNAEEDGALGRVERDLVRSSQRLRDVVRMLDLVCPLAQRPCHIDERPAEMRLLEQRPALRLAGVDDQR